jgi:hypothetical protein
MTSYANDEGKQLYRVPQRPMKSEETYARDDLYLRQPSPQCSSNDSISGRICTT